MKKWIIILLLFLPANTLAMEFPEIAGWTPEGQVNIHRKNDLWEYIDGGAELFLIYDFQLLRFRDFSKADMEMTVEIYDMATPLNAFGIYTTERPSNLKRLPIGTEAVIEPPYYAQLLKDRFYVKVKIQMGMLDESSGEAVLKSIDSFLKGNKTYPDELHLLPQKNKMSGTEKYIAQGYMGTGELNHILFADYEDTKENKYRYFIILPSADETIDKKWQDLSGKWKAVTEKGHAILYRDIPYSGKIGVIQKNNCILGISDVSDMDELMRRLIDIPQ